MGGGRARGGRRQRPRPVGARPARRDRHRVHARPGSTTTRPAGSRERLGVEPKRQYYSGIGGTTPQLLVQNLAEQILRSELDVALVVGAEALATQRRFKSAGERYPYSFKPEEKRPFPWEAPFHPAEVAHEVFQAWLTFAVFDNARRGAPRRPARRVPHAARRAVGALHRRSRRRTREAWFPIERSAEEIITAGPTNRMVGYPYTKYMVSIMDVDMAGALLLDEPRGRGRDGRARATSGCTCAGWCYATDPVYVAEHVDLWRSPAMEHAAGAALGGAGVGHRRRRAPRPVLVLRVVGELRARRARASRPTTRGRSPSPAGCRTTVARAATTSPTRSRRWPGCCATTRARSGW